jgi:hypothetical protein
MLASAIPQLPSGATFAKTGFSRPLATQELPVRDYGGYTDVNVPTVSWPGGKKLALNISIHFEEGAEATVRIFQLIVTWTDISQTENGDVCSETLLGEVCFTETIYPDQIDRATTSTCRP